jgi:hypothetical protein
MPFHPAAITVPDVVVRLYGDLHAAHFRIALLVRLGIVPMVSKARTSENAEPTDSFRAGATPTTLCSDSPKIGLSDNRNIC